MAIKILHLYPNELNLYGDNGNLLCLNYRLKKRGYKTEIITCGMGEKIPYFDIMFIGGGQDREMMILENDIKRKSDALKYCINEGKTILAICGGFQLLGEYYKTHEGKIITLANALPFYTVADKNRMIGNIVIDTKFGRVVGFENHSGKTYLDKSLNPLGKVIVGCGNNAKDGCEGLHYKNTFCTYLHGPVLPKNPNLADAILSTVDPKILDNPLNDDTELMCQNQLISRLCRKRK